MSVNPGFGGRIYSRHRLPKQNERAKLDARMNESVTDSFKLMVVIGVSQYR